MYLWRWTTWPAWPVPWRGYAAPRRRAWPSGGTTAGWSPRQLDDTQLVIRADFDYRDSLLRQFPGTFSVPARFTRHMMIVADIARGEAFAIEDALEAAWQLQRSAD